MPHVSIAIDSEFQSLIPPLSDDEYERLEKSILAEGVRDPIITWNGTIIDGHNRYHICDEHGIPFKTVEREFKSRDAAKIWIIENQFGRRNLSRYDRSVLALELEPLYQAEAERRHAANGGDHGNQYTGGKMADVQNSAPPPDKGKTRDKLAGLAGVSHDTIRKVKVIETEAAKGNETAIEARDAVKSGEKSIHKAYTEVRPNADKTDMRPLCTVCGEPIDDGDSYPRDVNKHKTCANRIEDEKKRRARQKAQRSEDGRRICTVCGEPIDEGDAYPYHPSMHKRCKVKRSHEYSSHSQYGDPDKALRENVHIYSLETLSAELTAQVVDFKEAIEESFKINESMGVHVTASSRKQLDRAISRVFTAINNIKEQQ